MLVSALTSAATIDDPVVRRRVGGASSFLGQEGQPGGQRAAVAGIVRGLDDAPTSPVTRGMRRSMMDDGGAVMDLAERPLHRASWATGFAVSAVAQV